MNDFSFNPDNLLPWVKAVFNEYPTIDNTHIKYISGRSLGKIKNEAIKAGHHETGTRGGKIKASIIAYEAQQIIRSLQREQFGNYRNQCRDELNKLGDVVSGICSCYDFISNQ